MAVEVHTLQRTLNTNSSRCCFAENGYENTKNYNARAQPLYCSKVLSFSIVPVAIAAVIFLNRREGGRNLG